MVRAYSRHVREKYIRVSLKTFEGKGPLGRPKRGGD
jgi:hypothetical protein